MNITFSAAFRLWLRAFTGRRPQPDQYEALMKRIRYVRIGKHHFTRHEMNERR